MAGHSKWANTKHRKARVDAKRGKIFSKIAKEILVAARQGGGDPESNITLRALIQKAKTYNMPSDNIDRAVKKGTGEGDSTILEEFVYEGYAPGGVAVLVTALTDNKNRTVGEVRHAFTKNGGNLAGQGSVAHMFHRKGQIFIQADGVDEDQVMELVVEAGAEDMRRDDDSFEILTDPATFMDVVDALDSSGISMSSSELAFIADTEVPVSEESHAASLIRFVDALEDLEDVQSVYANFNIDDHVLEALEAS
jgi:YebC/PmpR family DNA-binding regulatory protein